MRGLVRFLAAFLVAVTTATLVVGVLYWLFQTFDQGTRFASLKSGLSLLMAVWSGIAAIAALPAVIALGLSLLLSLKWQMTFLVVTGGLTGVLGFAILNARYAGDLSVIETWLRIFGPWPGNIIFASAGAVAGWTFAHMWQTSRPPCPSSA